MRNYPSIYEMPGTDTAVLTVVTDGSSGTSNIGASLITVTTVSAHGLLVGDPITIKALNNTGSSKYLPFDASPYMFIVVLIILHL